MFTLFDNINRFMIKFTPFLKDKILTFNTKILYLLNYE